MRLQQWKSNGWLQAHQTTPAQIADLLAIVDRDLEDSMGELSPDWQFGIAYTLGYRSDRTLNLEGSKPKAFLDLIASHSAAAKFDQAKALFTDWKSADLFFQLSDGEIFNLQQRDSFKDITIKRNRQREPRLSRCVNHRHKFPKCDPSTGSSFSNLPCGLASCGLIKLSNIFKRPERHSSSSTEATRTRH